jgi:hypothetical protein
MRDSMIVRCKLCRNEKLRRRKSRTYGSYIYWCPCREVKAQLRLLERVR